MDASAVRLEFLQREFILAEGYAPAVGVARDLDRSGTPVVLLVNEDVILQGQICVLPGRPADRKWLGTDAKSSSWLSSGSLSSPLLVLSRFASQHERASIPAPRRDRAR